MDNEAELEADVVLTRYRGEDVAMPWSGEGETWLKAHQPEGRWAVLGCLLVEATALDALRVAMREVGLVVVEE